MHGWLMRLVGVTTMMVAIVGLVRVAPVSVAAQTAQSLKTPWGEPDLQGIWASEFQIPLQRMAAYEGREFLTDAEIAEWDKKRLGMPTFSTRTAKRGTEQDVAGAYDETFQGEKRKTGRRTSLIVDPADGRIPPVTPGVQKKRAEAEAFRAALMQAVEVCKSSKDRECARVTYTGVRSPRRAEVVPFYLTNPGFQGLNRSDNPEDFVIADRCLGGQPPSFGGPGRIVQSPGIIALGSRIISTTGTPHPPAHMRFWGGDSRGRWEGNTLVVDVTNFSPKSEFRGSRENLHLIERYTRIDANTLQYVVTIEDPTTWVRSWTVRVDLARRGENQADDFASRCHDGNYAMTAMLNGARVEDKAFAEGRGPDPATKCYVRCGFDAEVDDPLN